MIGIRIKPTELSMVKIIDVVVVVSPILKMTFLPEAQRYVTMAALRGADCPSSSIKSCNIRLTNVDEFWPPRDWVATWRCLPSTA